MLRRVNEVEEAENGERPVSPTFFDDQSKLIPWYHKILLNKTLKVVIVMAIACFIAPILVYFYYYQDVYVKTIYTDGYSSGICSHSSEHRVPCGINERTTSANCSKDCCYDVNKQFCYHYIPSRYSFLSKSTWHESNDLTPRKTNIPYYESKPNLKSIRLHFDEISETHLNFLVYDPNYVTIPNSGNIVANKSYYYKIYYPEIYVEIFSEDDSLNLTKPLYSSARGALVASENLWEWNMYVSDDDLYGLGSIFLNSQLIYNVEGSNSTHSHPFLMAQRNGSFHGIYLEQDGPLDVNTIDSKVVLLKYLAGHKIEVQFFFGPSPKEVVDQFSQYIGPSDIPPYWALGVHFCRGNILSSRNVSLVLEEFYNFTESAEASGIPYDSDCIADGVFDFINFNMTEEDLYSVTSAVEGLRNKSKKFLPTLRPHVRIDNSEMFNAATTSNIFFLEPVRNVTYTNDVYNISVAFPDYSLGATIKWMKDFWPFSNLTDSFVLNDNWPKVFNGTANCFVDLPYVTKNINTTLCESIPWNARDPVNLENHINRHNLYGVHHANAVRNVTLDPTQAAPENLILSASSYPGIMTGMHVQNVSLTWDNFKNAYVSAVWNSILGHHVQSVPVCGDTPEFEDSEYEHLCIRWYLASVFLPVFRITSNTVERHPLAFSGYANKIMQSAIRMRYKLLPYFYGVLLSGTPLIRPLFYDYSESNHTFLIDEEFTVGEAIIIAPSFRTQQTSVSVYLPGNETFFDLWGGNEFPGINRTSSQVDIPILENEIIALLRAGYIIPIQETIYQSASETRMKSHYTLIVALNCTQNVSTTCISKGVLRISDTIVWSFEATETKVVINPSISSSRPTLCLKSPDGEFNEVSSSIINRLRIYGLTDQNNMGEYFLLDNLNLDTCALLDGEIFTISYW